MMLRSVLPTWPTFRTARRTAVRLAFSLPLALTSCVAGGGAEMAWRVTANAPPEAPEAPVQAAPQTLTLGLVDCLRLAFQKQPSLAAQRADLEAAYDRVRALDALQIPTCLAPELPIRRQQAALGVTAATACVDLDERQTVYAVTRTYFTVIYAREQDRVAGGVVERLKALNDTAARMLKAGARNVTDTDVDRTTVYLELAEARRMQAAKGTDRGLAGLKEAIGIGPECCLQVPPDRLPEPDVRLCLGDVVSWALSRRGELVKAGAFAQMTGLEVEAQATSHMARKATFASGGDIHSRNVPGGEHNNEYRPGSEPPEMPPFLYGPRPDRVKQAQTLSVRAAAMAEKARNLVALDAEDAFRRWEEASEKIPHTRKAAEAGDRLAESLRKDFAAGQKVKVDDVINAQVLAAQARSQYNEALYQQIIALADLERATAGGFCAGLAGQPVSPAKQPEKKPAPADKGDDEPR